MTRPSSIIWAWTSAVGKNRRIRTLDEAPALSDVLERLVECAGREAERAALLLVKGDRLKGWRLTGFTEDLAAKSIDLSVEEVADDAVPPFAADDIERHAISLPVHVGGETVAVLYADAPLGEVSALEARWPAVLDMLVRHAGRVLESMTVRQVAGLPVSRPLARASHVVTAPVEPAESR